MLRLNPHAIRSIFYYKIWNIIYISAVISISRTATGHNKKPHIIVHCWFIKVMKQGMAIKFIPCTKITVKSRHFSILYIKKELSKCGSTTLRWLWKIVEGKLDKIHFLVLQKTLLSCKLRAELQFRISVLWLLRGLPSCFSKD